LLDIQAELHEVGQPYQELYEAVVELKRRHDLHPCAVRPRDGMSLRSEDERETVQDLVARFRRLPDDSRRRLPALWNSLAQLEIVIGDLEAGQRDFQEVARLVSDPISRAEAHHNVYRAALERRDFEAALSALRRAVALDAETFEPFPLQRYEPRQVLGAGGLGVSFLCHDHASARSVVVKSLRLDSLDHEDAILGEARIIQDLDHPAVVRILDFGYGGSDPKRPYLVLEYFEGQTLAEYIARNGPLAPDEWLEICWPVGRALQGLHGRGVLHRSLRPGCVLLRKVKRDNGSMRFQVKLLDTGLGLKRSVIHACVSNPESQLHSGVGRSVARIVPFAPTEVVGRPKGQVWVGPHSDVYSFGRLCAFGLTGKPDPDQADRLLLPDEWQAILDDCTAWTFNRRPAHIGIVVDRIGETPGADEVVGRIERELHETLVAELTTAIEADPTSATAHANRGAAHARHSDFAAAVADFTEALRLQPGDAGLLRRRALAHARDHDPDGAIADYTEALSLEPHDLEALVNRGLAHAQKGEYERAIADYTEGLRLDPHDSVLYYNRGNAWYSRRDLARAIADYTDAIRLDPRNLWALGNRGKTHALRGEHARAIADFNRIIQLDPGNVKALVDRASSNVELGRADRAIADYTEAIRLQPTAGMYHDRGMAHVAAGSFENAVTDFSEALTLSPQNVPLLFARARAHAELGHSEAALADLDEILLVSPDNAIAFSQRGALRVRLGQHEQAIADCTEAIRIKPTAGAYFQRGNAYAEAGDHDHAIADYTHALQLDPKAAAALTNRGNSYGRLGDLERALADYDRALELASDDLVTLINRGNARARLGQLDGALADYTQVLRLDPAHARTYSSRGLIHSGRGDWAKALADFDQAIRLEPGTARPYNHRGNVRAERGDRTGAIADFSEALRLDRDYAAAWYNRGIAYSETGEYEKAAADFTEALRLEPAHVGALVNRGLARRRLNDTDGSLADFSAAVAADPELLAGYYNRAGLLAERGEYDAALADLDEILRRDADDIVAWISRGRIHTLRGDFEKAIADNLEGLKRSPDDARIANNLAWLFATAPRAELRDAARALELAQKACADSEDCTRLDTLAAALAACGQFEEAARCQQRAMELAPEDERADFHSRLELYQAGKAFVQEGSLRDASEGGAP
jgi:tetratricopeptide (TPR) repeat protein